MRRLGYSLASEMQHAHVNKESCHSKIEEKLLVYDAIMHICIIGLSTLVEGGIHSKQTEQTSAANAVARLHN